eukprot:g2991.t1
MDKPEPVSLDLDTARAASEASTLPSTPEQPSPARAGGSVVRMRRSRAPKRPRREAHAESSRWTMSMGVSTLSSTISKPDVVMKFSTMAAASGGVCLVVAVFSGPALVFLAVLALGVCGICYSVRQRGALEYLPSGVVDLLTRTTLLEWLTDTSVFDAVKTYLVFMMGLSEDETQGVLLSLPEDMRHTLTRPGIMHTLPRPLQDLLLPPNAAATANEQDAVGSRRRPRLAGTGGLSGAAAREQDSGDETEAPLGQLVWNPLPEAPVPGGEATGQGHLEEEDDPAFSDGSRSDGSGEESTDEEEEEEARRERGRSAHWAGGADDDTRRRPWGEEFPRRAVRSGSPVAGRGRTRGRAVTDVAEVDGDGVQSARRVSSAVPEQARRREATASASSAAAGWFGGGRHLATARAAADEIVPSAERLVASILQRRVDSAVKAAWNAVDEQGVRRAAVGSGLALAAHMAFSERARRQAGAMLRGGFLAALAGTATVCAGLVYLKPGESVREESSSDANDDSDRQESAETEGGDEEEDTDVDVAMATSIPEDGEGGENASRMRRYRDGMRRWLTAVSPSTRNLVRLLGMICILLAVRKWQLLRRAALRATMPRSMYGSTPP